MKETTTKEQLSKDINNTQDTEELCEVIDKLPKSYVKGYLVCFMDDNESDDFDWMKQDIIEKNDYLSDDF